MRTIPRLPQRTLALALALFGTLACQDATATAKHEPEPPLQPGIHPVLVVTPEAGEQARVELRLRRVEVASEVASYQGELVFDREQMTLRGAEVPTGIMGAWNEVEPGRIRFAGARIDGVGNGAVLVLRVTPKGALEPEAFQVRLTELTEVGSFTDLTPRVVASPRPLLVRAGTR